MRMGVIGAMQMGVDNLKAVMEDVTTETYSGEIGRASCRERV